MFKREAIQKVVGKIGKTQWAFDVDLLYELKREKFKIKETATVWEDKKGSRLNLKKVPLQMFLSVVRLRLMYSPFKFVVKLYDKLPEKNKDTSLIIVKDMNNLPKCMSFP